MDWLHRVWMALPFSGRPEEHAADIRQSQAVRRRAERVADTWNERIQQSWEQR